MDEEAIKKCFFSNAYPPTAKTLDSLNAKCPRPFLHHLPSQPISNSSGPPPLLEVSVSIKERSVDLETVDFVFGGSTLEMLATMKTSQDNGTYIAVKVPGTPIVYISRKQDYVKNLANLGFQFERFVTGLEFSDCHDHCAIKHLQQITIGGYYNVLFSAECDAVDNKGNRVEIKASNPRYWGTKVMFQMLSSGSLSLYSCVKRQDTLVKVMQFSLQQVINMAMQHQNAAANMEQNILRVMNELRIHPDLQKEGSMMELQFVNQTLHLIPYIPNSNDPVLPPEYILKYFLEKS